MNATVQALLGEAEARDFILGLRDSPAFVVAHTYVKVLPNWDWSDYGSQRHDEVVWYMGLARGRQEGWTEQHLKRYLRQKPAPTKRMRKFLEWALEKFREKKGDRLVFAELHRDLQVEPFPVE